MKDTKVSNNLETERVSEWDIIRCIHLLEKRAENSLVLKRWDKKEILICLDEIKVGIKKGSNPKYSVRMLLTYCSSYPILSHLAQRISELISK